MDTNTGAWRICQTRRFIPGAVATSLKRKRVIRIVKDYTEGELKEALSKLTILVDSRENVNDHITGYFDEKKIPYKVRKLDQGDYSATLGDYTMEYDICIERKNSLSELCGNFGTNRERFEREFTRAKAVGAKTFLLIENNTLDDVYLGNYRSQMKPQSLIASLLMWQVRYNTTIMFCNKKNSAKLIYGILYYYAREVLLYGSE